MSIEFTCVCGETLRVEEAQKARKIFCPKCRKSVEVPADAKVVEASAVPEAKAAAAAPDEVPAKGFDGAFEPRHVERVKGGAGEPDRWKLTCYCGKRIVSPLRVGQATGRCPKCGRRLKLPGYRPGSGRRSSTSDRVPAKPVPPTPGLPETLADVKIKDVAAAQKDLARAKARSAEPDTATIVDDLALSPSSLALSKAETKPLDGSAPKTDEEDEIGTIVMEFDEEALIRETGANKAAALKTADILRAHKISSVERSGLISAWPLAGKLPRALSGFIDVTFATTAMGLVVVMASLKILPESCQHVAVAVAAFIAAGLINDVLLQMTGGTLGKRLVVLVVRRRGGREVEPGRLVLRACLKWLLIPGWLVAFVDPAERSLHDIVCGTLVLKGRAR
ncbi:MAG: RDD family protein [Planctomycetota bacterium]|nr:RDD family protein [Planctomycetota bacterium]